jgi:DnaK suppressor protein
LDHKPELFPAWITLAESHSMTIDIDKAKQRLAAKRDELLELSDLSSQARDPVELDQQSVGRLSRMDAIQHQEMAAALERARQRDLLRIDQATSRIADGEYGYCADCDSKIPDGRLAIDPMAEKCVNCA